MITTVEYDEGSDPRALSWNGHRAINDRPCRNKSAVEAFERAATDNATTVVMVRHASATAQSDHKNSSRSTTTFATKTRQG